MTSTPIRPTPMTARTPEDVLAAVPVVLGFVPRDSVVMLTSGGSETFQARVDLPPPDDPAVAVAVDLLLEPALQHQVSAVVFVLYSTDPEVVAEVGGALVDAFTLAGILVVETLVADGQRWHPLGHADAPALGVPYDLGAHPFHAQAVWDGRILHGSREELAAVLDPVPEAVADTALACRRAVPADAEEVSLIVAHRVHDGRFSTEELAAILLGVQDRVVRDATWSELHREVAEDHVRLWTDAVQRSPDDLAGPPAAVLALAAWLAGHGALAWCAVDRSQAVDPTNSLSGLVSDLLMHAVAPSAWDRSGPAS